MWLTPRKAFRQGWTVPFRLFYGVLCSAIALLKGYIMPRPKGRLLPHRVSVALTGDQLAALEELAASNSAPVSWLVRRAVSEFLERSGHAEQHRLPVQGKDFPKEGPR